MKICRQLYLQQLNTNELFTTVPRNNNRNQKTAAIFQNARQSRNALVVLTGIVTVCFAVPHPGEGSCMDLVSTVRTNRLRRYTVDIIGVLLWRGITEPGYIRIPRQIAPTRL